MTFTDTFDASKTVQQSAGPTLTSTTRQTAHRRGTYSRASRQSANLTTVLTFKSSKDLTISRTSRTTSIGPTTPSSASAKTTTSSIADSIPGIRLVPTVAKERAEQRLQAEKNYEVKEVKNGIEKRTSRFNDIA
ncbi:hypothetical protein Tcan_01586, partial [Toxocara canis]